MIAKVVAGTVVTVAAAGGGTGVAYSVSVKHIGDVIKEKNLVLVDKEDTGWDKIWEVFKTRTDLKDEEFKKLKNEAGKSDASPAKTKTDLYNECERVLGFFHSSLFRSTPDINAAIIEDFEKVCVAKISTIHTVPDTIKSDLLKDYAADASKNKPDLTDELKGIQTDLADNNKKTQAEGKIKPWCDREKEKWYLGMKDPIYLLVSNICKAS